MINILVEGIGLGLLIAVLVGPVFFLLVQTSMHKGFIPALYLALGISTSDATYIGLTYFGFAQFGEDSVVKEWMGIGGGILLIVFGMIMIFKKPIKTTSIQIDYSTKERLKYFIKGYTLNFINPSVCLFWIGAVGMISLRLDYNNYKIGTFFVATVSTVFATDLLKIYLSKRLTGILSDKVMFVINRVSGFAMVIYGTKLVFDQWIQ